MTAIQIPAPHGHLEGNLRLPEGPPKGGASKGGGASRGDALQEGASKAGASKGGASKGGASNGGASKGDTMKGAAIVCHPHPEYGGTMHTKAVFRAAQALTEAGLAALRFNFRGVGTSTGSFGGGEGEGEDARAALAWLAERYPDLPLVVGGFSFGSRFGLPIGLYDTRVVALMGLGLPAATYDFGFLAGVEKPTLIVQGEHDEFGGRAEVEALAARLGGRITLRVIPGSDHYFHDHFDELRREIRSFFETGPGAEALAGG